MAIAITIGSGAGLQAWVGYVLVRRALSAPILLEQVNEVLLLLFYGGMASCVLNATLSTTLLYTVGFVPINTIPFHWFTWWAGDVIGVLVFTPILLLLFAPASQVSRPRKTIVGCSLTITFLIIVYLFHTAKEYEATENQFVFNRLVTEITQEFRKDLKVYLNILVANERFIISSEQVSAQRFYRFTETFLKQYSGIHSLSWNPRITDQERDAFETSVQQQGYPDYVIKDRSAMGKIAIAPRRELYFPVGYLAPYELNQTAHGHDTYGNDPVSGDVRARTLDKARDEGRPLATGRLSLIQADQTYGLLIYHPVYASNKEIDSLKKKRETLIGYVAGVFLIPKMIKANAERASQAHLHMILRDLKSTKENQLLYDSRTSNFQENPTLIPIPPNAMTSQQDFEFAGRQWEIQFIHDIDKFVPHHNWSLWAV